MKDANQGITELNLSNNLITADCVSLLTKFSNLRVLNLSYNDLGPDILKRLPDLLQSMPSLREIKLEHTHLGDHVDMFGDIKEAYISHGMTAAAGPSLTLNLSNNHFYQDNLWEWTNVWVHLKRLSSLHLSNVTSDTGWDNFQLLSDLSK